MKKIISIITVTILCLCLLSMTVLAASAQVTANGPQSVTVGQTIDVKLTMNGSDIYGMSGKISYDASLLKLNSSSSQASDWQVEFYGNNFVVYDNAGEHPVNGSVNVVVLNFTVLDAAAGKTVSVAFTDLVATDAENDIPVSNATYSCAVKAKEVTPPATTEPTQKPTEPATTEPTQKPTEPATTEVTEEPTEVVTEEPTEAVTGEPTEPTEPGEPEIPDEHRCLPWWLLIVALVLGLVIGYLVGNKTGKKKEEAA